MEDLANLGNEVDNDDNSLITRLINTVMYIGMLILGFLNGIFFLTIGLMIGVKLLSGILTMLPLFLGKLLTKK